MATELDKLQGTWRVASLETDGSTRPSDELTDAAITVRGNRFTSVGMGDAYNGTIELFPRKKPKAFDLVFTSGPPEGARNCGIYRLDDETWTICLATRGNGRRPSSFKTKPDSGLSLETLVRGDAPQLAKTKAVRVMTAPPEATSSPTEIEGEWLMESAVFNGKPLAPEMRKWCKRVTLGNITKVFAGPNTMLDATFELDPERGQIDYVNRSGENKGKAQTGIYDLRDNRLRICMAAPGKKRPGDFSSTRGDGRSYTVWRRRKPEMTFSNDTENTT
jgi:uncharacterized protein (TIGR03067 family)